MTDTLALRIPGARRAALAADRRYTARRSLKRAAMRHARHVVVEVSAR